MSGDAVRSTIDAYVKAFSTDDREGWLACFAADAWAEDPIGSGRKTGHDELGGFFDASHPAPGAVTLTPTVVKVVGDEASFAMQVRVAFGDQTFGMDVIDVMTFDADAKITTMRAFYEGSDLGPI